MTFFFKKCVKILLSLTNKSEMAIISLASIKIRPQLVLLLQHQKTNTRREENTTV
jgi:hypothetical protein